MMRIATLCLARATFLLLGFAGVAGAYSQYSVDKDATNCRLCHGDFRASTYTSLVDEGSWPDGLHDTHREVMLNGDCDACHSSGPPFPVLLGSSAGGEGLAAISCSGCHGRAEDGTGSGSEGFGAGLRQHHWRHGVQSCGSSECHTDDSDPSLFTPVAENVLPPYYADSDPKHPSIPADPCNLEADGFLEDYAASTLGTDNDGDDLYDEQDVRDCPEPGESLLLGSAIGLMSVLRRRRVMR